jgi:hypothetical protein
MVPAMRMVAASRFRYSGPSVPWTDADWMSCIRSGYRFRGQPGDFLLATRAYPSAPLVLPAVHGGCAEMHPVVRLVQANRSD